MDGLYIDIPAPLRRLVAETANKEGVNLNVFVARVLAAHFGKPELGIITTRAGRKPKEFAEAK